MENRPVYPLGQGIFLLHSHLVACQSSGLVGGHRLLLNYTSLMIIFLRPDVGGIKTATTSWSSLRRREMVCCGHGHGTRYAGIRWLEVRALT